MNALSVSMSKMVKRWVSLLVMLTGCLLPLDAAYIQVYNTTTNGALAWTGNTLGLNKAIGQNNPGTAGSIGAFITQNGTHVNNYPAGTTLDWTSNGSSAVLDIPSGSTILHAELIWSGSFGYGSSTDPDITLDLVNATSVNFITPDTVVHSIAPRTDTAQSRYQPDTQIVTGFYVRSADVTSLVQGGGTYIVGNVPATVAASENNLNCAGWTLAVVLENPNMYTSNSTLYVACEASGNPPASVTGFQAPTSGTIVARVFTSCLEGDAQLTGDSFRIGPSTPLSTSNKIYGTNNPINNFFASQINTSLNLTTDVITGKLVYSGSGQLDMRGDFGSTNSNAADGTGVSGARQGYDITSIDISDRIANGQTQLYAQGTTSGDVYTTNALGLQIQVLAPVIQSNQTANPTSVSALGDVVTYTSTFTNIGLTAATSVVFTDLLPPGLTYVPDSLTYNGSSVPGADIVAGVPLLDLGVGDTATVVFQARVTSISPPNSYENSAAIQYSFSSSGSPITVDSQTNTTVVTGPTSSGPVANPDSYTTNANVTLTVNASSGVLANDTGTGLIVSVYDSTSAQGGTVNLSQTGSFSYSPPSNFSGTDTFGYTIKDSSDRTSSTTVTITVLPQAISDSGSVTANTTLNQTTSVLNNDLGSDLTVTFFTQPTQSGSSVLVNSNGTYTYTPAHNFSGTDTFTYTATDSSGNSSIATVTITVLPKASDDYGTTSANTTLHGTTVFSNDTSGLKLIAYDSTSVQGGTVTMDDNPSSHNYGTYNYTPPTGYSGSDSFTYTVKDSAGNTSTATVLLTVLPQAFPDTGTTTTNTPLNQTVSVLNNDVGTNMTVSNYDHNSIQGGGITMQPNGTYTYMPPSNFSGTDTFRYILKDQLDNTSTTTVTITVNPLANNDTATTRENTTLLGPSVLLNDQGSSLRAVAVTTTTAKGGTVSMNADGTYTYMPPTGFVGTDTFQYEAVDASDYSTFGTVTITVTPIPPPTNFVGRICKCEFLNKTVYNLETTWKAPSPPDSSIKYYGIFLNGKMVAKVLVGAPLVFRTSSTSKNTLYLYEIKSFDINNTPSASVKVRIVSEGPCCEK